jgi:hypothetical protein
LLFRRNVRDQFEAKVRVCTYRFDGRTPQPPVQRDIDKLIGLEHFQKQRIGIAGVLDVMSRNPGNEAYIVGI